jgi:ankyrin repeat protein
MGAWSTDAFGNDEARDLLLLLKSPQGDALLLTQLVSAYLEAKETGASIETRAIAACAIIAAASNDPIKGINVDAKEWIQTSGYVPSKQDIMLALDAATRISKKSELLDLWEDVGDLKRWQAGNTKLVLTLKAATVRRLPSRKAKPVPIPRLLWKQLELYQRQPTPELKALIQRKVASLKTLNEVSSDTGIHLPVTLLITHGFLEEAKQLILRGADPTMTEERYGNPPAYLYACTSGDISLVKFIFSRGVSPFAYWGSDDGGLLSRHSYSIADFKAGITPHRYSPALGAALRRGHIEVARNLIGLGADAREAWRGETALHRAVESGDVATVKFVLGLGVNLNSISQLKESALHWILANEESRKATSKNRCAIAKLLIDAGIELSLVDKFGMTALDSAIYHGDAESAKLLKRYGAVETKQA